MLVLTGPDPGVPVLLIIISFPPHLLDDHDWWWSGSYASAERSELSCKNLSSLAKGNVVAIQTPAGQSLSTALHSLERLNFTEMPIAPKQDRFDPLIRSAPAA